MSSSNIGYSRNCILFMAIISFSCSTCFAERGGGFHQNNGDHQNDGYHQNNEYNYVAPNAGNYHQDNGAWVAPVVIDPAVNDTDCQTVQQCDSDGNCIESQNCN